MLTGSRWIGEAFGLITCGMSTTLTFATLVLLIIAVGCSHSKPSSAAGKFEDLGVQITSSLIQGSTFAKLPDGRDVVCTVIRGKPAKLLIFDINSGSLLHRLSLGDADGAWNAATASDGSVYVSTDDKGHLFRWVPGESQAKDLGQVAPEQTFAWDVCAGADGEVFVSTYPGCLVIRYHPRDGFRDIGKGAVAPGENYARGLTYDPAGGKIYIAVGAHAHLIELDPKNGAKRDILPNKYKDKKFCYSADIAGGKLFALITDAETAVMDLKTGTFEATIPNANAQLVLSQKSPNGDLIYYNISGKIGWYDLKTHQHGVAAEDVGGVLGLHWIGNTLIAFSKAGGIMKFDPASKALTKTKIEIPPEPTSIHYIARGPDGKVYCGGYLSGGLSIVDPQTGKGRQFDPLPQTEGITTLGDRVYFGCYPQARLYRFSTTQPWGKDNPHLIDNLHRVGQDRPFAAVGVESLNKVFFGHVPDYGTLGGALAVVDGSSDKVTVQRNLIPDHSIVALTQLDEQLIGGTSIRGGLGIDAKATDAKLFIWDPASEKVVFETAPVKGARLITGLLVMPDKKVWGWADGTLFIFDPATRKIIKTKKLLEVDNKKGVGWRNAMMELHKSGQIYGIVDHRFIRLDPKTLKLAVLKKGDDSFGLLATDRDGRLYFRDGPNLWRFTP